MEIKRDRYIERLRIRKHNGMVKVITGIRRCGKSYLLNNLFYDDLLKSGVDKSHIIKFAFDSESDLSLIGEDYYEVVMKNKKINPRKFSKYIRSQIKDNDMYYLLLDEVQNLLGFEYVLNGYLREDNLDVYVTGSNSKFLSTDVITEFAGRGDVVHVLPLSFSEYYQVNNSDTALKDYMNYGGLPAVALMESHEQKSEYLKNQMKNVYLRDIVLRNNLYNDRDLNDLINIVASGISSLTNPSKLSNTFKSIKKANISPITIDKYLDFAQEAFIISKVNRYDIKGNKYIYTPYKIYFEDVGLRNAQINFRQIEYNHIMENIIYNELRYRGFDVDVGLVEQREVDINNGHEDRKFLEIDFVANLADKRYYIQSAFDIPSWKKLEQESRPFDKIDDSFKKILIVRDLEHSSSRSNKGYLMLGLKYFLLNYDSLDL